MLADEIQRPRWQSDRVRFALATLALSFASFLGTSLPPAAGTRQDDRPVAIPEAPSLLGIDPLVLACIQLPREALASERLEVAVYRYLQARREAEGCCGAE